MVDSLPAHDPVHAPGVGKATRVDQAVAGHPARGDDLDAQLEPQGEGRLLEAPIKHQLETETGYRLDQVRIHIGGPIGKLLGEHGKRGAAKGRHILLADGEYAPDSEAGKQLLRHELNHVIQQASGKVASDDPQHRAGLEADADRAPAHHGGKELRELSPPNTGPAQFMVVVGDRHFSEPTRPTPVHHASSPVGDRHFSEPSRPAPVRPPPPRPAPRPVSHPAPVRRPTPVYHAPARPVYHPPVGDDHWNDARRAAPAARHAPAHHSAPPVGDDHWNDARRAHPAPAHPSASPVGDDHWNDHARSAPAHHSAPPVGDDHWNDHAPAPHAPGHPSAPPVGDDHWNDANLRGHHIATLAHEAATRARGADMPIVGPTLQLAAREKFLAQLSPRDRADLAAYEHAEHIVHDGVAAVKRDQAAERGAAEHHSPFSLHTLTSAGRGAAHAAGDLGGDAVHAVAHAPETVKDAAVGAYHHPVEAARALLDAAGLDTDDMAEALDDLEHGRIKHLVTQRLKTAAGAMLAHPGNPLMLGRGKDYRQVFDDYAHGDLDAARHHALKIQIHEALQAVMLLPPGKAGKALAALGALSKLSKVAKAEEVAAAETRIAEGAAHVRPHGKPGAAPRGGGDVPQGEPRAREAPDRGKPAHDEAPDHGEPAHDGKPAHDATPDHGKPTHEGKPAHDATPHDATPHDETPAHDETPDLEAPHEAAPPREQPAPRADEPHGADGPAHDGGHDTSNGAPGKEVGNPAEASVRAQLDNAVQNLRRATGIQTSREVEAVAFNKARRAYLAEHAPRGKPSRKIKKAADRAGREAASHATGDLRELQATMVEKLFDLADLVGVPVPPGAELILVGIRTGRFFPSVRAALVVSTDRPRAALIKILRALQRQAST